MSVRARLTALVVVLALGLGLVAAIFGVDEIEDQLVSDELDASAAEQLAAIPDLLELDADNVIFVEEFNADAEVASLTVSLSELVGTESLDGLLEAVSHEPGETVVILTYFGEFLAFDPDALTLEGPIDLDDDDRPVITQSVIEELFFVTTEFDLEDVFDFDDDELADVVEGEGLEELALVEPDGLVFSTRTIEDAEFVVFADVAGVTRGVDRIRTIVWGSIPLLVVGGGLIAWFLTGRALRPVHAITRRVGEISSGNLHERVPQPGTGDEIAELAATMNAMLDRLEVDDRRLRQFVSDASHELRSPVAVLRSEAEVARRTPDGTSVEALADGVLLESTRLQRIVEDLLVLARGEERQGGSRRVEVDVDDMVLTEARRQRLVPVDTRAVSAGRILATPESVGRIVTHLLDNAARHAASRIEVGLRAEDDEVRLWVDDDGPGVPMAERDRIFERFTRLDDARTRDRGGAGLGLAVVAESVRAMGGRVGVEDSPTGGARFVVRWPIAA